MVKSREGVSVTLVTGMHAELDPLEWCTVTVSVSVSNVIV